MNDDILLNGNVVDICYHSVQMESKKIENVLKQILQFYCKHVLGTSKNTYVAFFLATKIRLLERASSDSTKLAIYRKLLAEVYLLLGTCKKNNDATKQNEVKIKKLKLSNEDTEKLLLNEINTYRRLDIILGCVTKLFKTKTEILWRVAESISPHTQYVKSLAVLYHYCEKKEFMFEAFKTLSPDQTYYYDNGEYTNLILQCMLKINYIYEETARFDKHLEIYLTCLNYPLKGLSNEAPLQYNRLSYIHEESNKKMTIEPKAPQEYMIFEKVSDM